MSQRLLIAQGFLGHPFAPFGIPGRPYALSSGAAVQLHEICMGERAVPEAIRSLAYGPRLPPDAKRARNREAYKRRVETGSARGETEIALIELSTPIEPFIGEAIVNLNMIRHRIIEPLRKTNIDPKLVSKWGASLSKAGEDLKERADLLLKNWPDDFEDDGVARFGVDNLCVRRLSIDDMVGDLERLRDRLRTPMALQLYQFRYMPAGPRSSGRPVSRPSRSRSRAAWGCRPSILPR